MLTMVQALKFPNCAQILRRDVQVRMLGCLLGSLLVITGCSHAPQPSQEAARSTSVSTGPQADRLPRLDPSSPEFHLEEAVDVLARDIEATLSTQASNRIAVMPFARLTGGVPELGLFIADKLTNRLFASEHGITVVDRFHIDEALNEISFGYSSLQDPASAQQIGKMLGADAVITGTMTRLDTYFDVTARLLRTETLDVIATAEARVPISKTTDNLWNTTVPGPSFGRSSKSGASTGSTSMDGRASLPPEVFYFEDFSQTPKGSLPNGWTATDDVVVDRGNDGKPQLQNLEVREFQTSHSPKISLPRDFDIEIVLWWDFGQVNITVGSLEVQLRDTGSVGILPSIWGDVNRRLENALHTITIQKRKPVYTVLVDGTVAVRGTPPLRLFAGSRIGINTTACEWPARVFGVRSIRCTQIDSE